MPIKKIVLVWLSVVGLQCAADQVQSAVTYNLTGRFGDNILTYCRAKWLAQMHGLDLLYRPIAYSEYFMVHELERHYQRGVERHYQTVRGPRATMEPNDGTLYVINHLTETDGWYNWNNGDYPKEYDEKIMSILKRNFQLRVKVPLPELPHDMICVAVHVRKGGGYDKPLLTEQNEVQNAINKDNYVDVDFPLKFPPDQFYIDQLIQLSAFFDNRSLYVYLFTDDKNPQRLADKFSQTINNPRITFDYRKTSNGPTTNVVNDFVAMMQFDCLIRGDSSYSKAAQLLGDFSMVIYPTSFHWENTTLIIDNVATYIAQDNCKKLKEKSYDGQNV